jgi:transposase-like protein
MINLKREPLRGDVEVDDTWVGGTQAGLRGSRQLKGRKAALVLVAVEKGGRTTTGGARMAVIPDFRKETLLGFLNDNVEPGTTVYTDGLKSFTKEEGRRSITFKSHTRSQRPVPAADRNIDFRGTSDQCLRKSPRGDARPLHRTRYCCLNIIDDLFFPAIPELGLSIWACIGV